MKHYEITKHYRNTSDIYYISLGDEEEVTEDMLQNIAENTNGGENYGYRIESKEIENLPDGATVLNRRRTVNIY